MNKNNNIEDFFNASMEQFDGVPPASVWDKVEKKLDKKPPFFKTPLFWTGLILAGLIASGIYFYIDSSQERINILMGENEELKSQKGEMEMQLTECNYRSLEAERLLDSYSALQQEKEQKKKTEKKNTPKIKKEEPIEKSAESLSQEYNIYKEIHPTPNLQQLPKVTPQIIETKTDSNLYLDEDGLIIQEETKTEFKVFSIIDTTSNNLEFEVEGVQPDLTPKFVPKTKEWFQKQKDKLKKLKRNRNEEE